MSMPNGSDPIDRLRAADPVRAHDVPDASLARVTARIQEHIVTDIQHTTTAAPSRRPFALFGGIALAGAFALAIAFGSGFGAQAPGPVGAVPSPSEDPAAGGGGWPRASSTTRRTCRPSTSSSTALSRPSMAPR